MHDPSKPYISELSDGRVILLDPQTGSYRVITRQPDVMWRSQQPHQRQAYPQHHQHHVCWGMIIALLYFPSLYIYLTFFVSSCCFKKTVEISIFIEDLLINPVFFRTIGKTWLRLIIQPRHPKHHHFHHHHHHPISMPQQAQSFRSNLLKTATVKVGGL